MCKKTASDGLFCGFPTGIVLYWQRNTVLMRESPINKTRIACFPAGGEAARARRSIYCIARCPAADVLSGKRMGLRESAVAVQARGAAPDK